MEVTHSGRDKYYDLSTDRRVEEILTQKTTDGGFGELYFLYVLSLQGQSSRVYGFCIQAYIAVMCHNTDIQDTDDLLKYKCSVVYDAGRKRCRKTVSKDTIGCVL